MPNLNINLSSRIEPSFRVQQVKDLYSLQDVETSRQNWNVSLPIEEKDWKIGLITGASGSGKTTIAKHIFKDSYFHQDFEWDERSVLDNLPDIWSFQEISQILCSVGLSSPVHWIKPYSILSNGQKFRCDLARCLMSQHKQVIFDEFTSVVDRDVAKVCCANISKVLRRGNCPRFIFLSCHYDIIDWLQPDWTYDVSEAKFESRELRRRPQLELQIYKTNHSIWPTFREHHYLSHSFNQAAQVFVAYLNDRPIAMTSYLHFPHPVLKNAKQAHRTVVMPDFQGLGIGNALSDWAGAYCTSKGNVFISTTSHPSMVWHRKNSPKWQLTRVGRVASNAKKGLMRKSYSQKRMTYSFRYKA